MLFLVFCFFFYLLEGLEFGLLLECVMLGWDFFFELKFYVDDVIVEDDDGGCLNFLVNDDLKEIL